MVNTICLDNKYSTTRLLTQEKPEITNNSNDKFETALFLPIGENRKGEGGLRTKGYFKKSFENKPLLSVITVVYNGEKYLEETIQSVINQTYDNVEYIIIDGGSIDGTLDIIKKYEEKIDYWVSEKDKGIYDAMNKGIDSASGNWINFMNAGDCFFDKNILNNIFNINKYENIDILYGDLKIQYKNFFKFQQARNLNTIWQGMAFSHQSCFISTSYHKKNKYDLKYKITADFNLIYNAYINKYEFFYLNSIIATVIPEGLSDSNHLKVHKEVIKVVLNKELKVKYLIYYYYYYLIIIIKLSIKRFLGYKIINMIRKIL